MYARLAAIGRHEHSLWLISLMGSPLGLLLGTAALIAVASRLRWRSALWLALLAPGLAAVVTTLLLKPLVGRSLDGEYALPSGHTATITGMATVAVVLLVASGRLAGCAAAVLSAGAVLVVLAVAVSMVATYRHYGTDAVAGALVALGVVALVALALDRWSRNRDHRSTEGSDARTA